MIEADEPSGNTAGSAKSLGLRRDPSFPVLGETDDRKITYVIAIGIDEYRQAKLRLDNCKADCDRLIAALEGGYQNIVVEKRLYDEAAGAQAILDAVKTFCNDKDKNRPGNNLLLYYSGHGGFIPTPARKIGSWVPINYKEEDVRSQLGLNTLMDELEYLEVTHLMVISDCCYAGSMFEAANLYFQPSEAPIPWAEDLGMEASRWGIASSRKHETSGAGEPGKNSLFTAALIEKLQNNSSARLSFGTLAQQLKEKFSANPGQRVEYKELKIAKYNTGEFSLEAIPDSINSRKRYDYLNRNFRTLNYEKQKRQFVKFESATRPIHFTFISGTPQCGLYFLSVLARESNGIGAHDWIAINPQYVSGSAHSREERLLQIFKLILKDAGKASSFEAVKTYLIEQLKGRSFIIELRFYNTVGPSVDVTPQRKEVVEDLANFAATINQLLTGDNRLYIFVVDLENADYKALIPDSQIPGVDTLILDKVSVLSVEDFQYWYNDTQIRSDKVNGISEFKLLFDDLIYKRVPDIFEKKEAQAPAFIIERVCSFSDCSALAEKLLNQ